MFTRKWPVELVCGGQHVVLTGRWLKLLRLRSEFHEPPADPIAFVEAVKRSGLRADVLTFVQRVQDGAPRFAYRHEFESMALLRLTTYDDWFTKQLYNKPRNMIRKAAKSGVEVRLEAFSEPLVRGIKEIYDETPLRQGKRNYHYRESLETIRETHATFLDRSQFITSYYAGELIGFAKLTFSQDCGILMNFLSRVSHRDKAVNNALLAKAVEVCAERKVGCLVYGHWGGGGTRGLAEFKAAHGFERVEVPRYFVPLSAVGKVALTLGAHRGLVHVMPAWLVESAAKARSRWNTMRLGTPKVD